MKVQAPELNKQTGLQERTKNRITAFFLHLTLIVGAVIMLTPLLWMLATALSPNTLIPPTSLLPDFENITLENFKHAWLFPKDFSTTDAPFNLGTFIGNFFRNMVGGEWKHMQVTMGTFFLNSLICTVVITVLGVLVDSLAAYVLAFKEFKGKGLFVYLALATMMIPVYVTLVPEYLIVVNLKWTNTYQAMIIPFLASGMGISLFRSHFLGLSRELEECAKIDGASNFRVYSTIIMPISKPVIGTMTILKAMWSWNQYIWPLIVSTNIEMKTIQIALNLFRGQNFSQWGYLCAGMTLAILPMFIVFLACQKQFIGGLTAGAVKG